MSYFSDSFDREIIKLLQNGAVGFMPSDTIYGLSCRALDKTAVERVHKLKSRNSDKPCVVLISDIRQLSDLKVDQSQADTVADYWPGKISLEFDARRAPAWLHRGTGHFAIRLPDYLLLRELIRQVGPILSTSANPKGTKPANSVAAAWTYFGEGLDFYIDAGKINTEPSTIVVIKDGKLEVDRLGAVKIDTRGKIK
ncbi:MAG: L-threonylcarbamoyladenylate synthase [Patescibacteria group bacterium]